MQNIASTQGFGSDWNDTFGLFILIFSDIWYPTNQKRKPVQRQALMTTLKSPLNPEFVWSVYSKINCYEGFKIIHPKKREVVREGKRERGNLRDERGERVNYISSAVVLKQTTQMYPFLSFFKSFPPLWLSVSLSTGCKRALGDGGRPWSIHFHAPYGNSVVCTEEVCSNSDLSHMCFRELQTQQSCMVP